VIGAASGIDGGMTSAMGPSGTPGKGIGALIGVN
jgi:hypothetical protein